LQSIIAPEYDFVVTRKRVTFTAASHVVGWNPIFFVDEAIPLVSLKLFLIKM
jgi:hypothetical protein